MRLDRCRAAAAVVLFAVLAGPAWSQTVLSPVPADPATIRLQERVEELERQLREETGEIERLRNDVQRTQAELARLNAAMDDLLLQIPRGEGAASGLPAAGGAAAPAPATTQPAPRAAPARPPAADADAAYRGAQQALQLGDFAAAERAFRAFLEDFPNNPQAPDARYWLGQTLLSRNDFSGAADQFIKLVQTAPNAERAPDAVVRLGMALKGLDKKREACLAFRDLPRRYPNAPQSTKEFASREARALGCPA